MINVNDLKPGMSYLYEGNLYLCLSLSLNKTAMRKMIVKAHSKDWRKGSITDVSFNGGDKIEEVFLDKDKVQYLYDEGDSLVFMNPESFEQISINKSKLEWEMNFITDGLSLEITAYNGEILGVALPAKVTLEVVSVEPGAKGDTVKTALKEATLSTGYKIKVPQFVNAGDKIIVRSDTGEYDSRA